MHDYVSKTATRSVRTPCLLVALNRACLLGDLKVRLCQRNGVLDEVRQLLRSRWPHDDTKV